MAARLPPGLAPNARHSLGTARTARMAQFQKGIAMTARQLAERLGDWRKVGARYLVHCPAHDDQHPSLELGDGDKGVVMICRAGCAQDRVVDLICERAGIARNDLFYTSAGETKGRHDHLKIIKTYDYVDTQGTLLFQAVRYDPKAFRQRRPDGNGGWIWNIDGVELVLYRLPEVREAVQAGRIVHIAAGEQDVETLRAMGFVASCDPMGAGYWRTAYTEPLLSPDVVILPDNDAPGHKHAQQVAKALHGIAASIKVVELPALPAKGDVSDWLQAGGSRQQLEALVAVCPLWPPVSTGQAPTIAGATRQLHVTSLATVMPERVHWLWRPYLPLGRPVALEGDPGVGKSSLVANIVAHLTSSTPFPNVIHGQVPQPFAACNVCLLTAEDDPGDTILPRIAVNGGDPTRVFLIDGWHQPDGAQGVVTMQDLDLLQQALEQYTPRLLVFDPVQSFFGRKVDMNSASDTRRVLDAVFALCKRQDCTPSFVRHIGKARREKALYAGLGSIDITATMRSVLFLGQDPDNDQRRILAQSKANNARLGPSLAYKIVSVEHDLLSPTGDRVTVEAPRLDWDGLSPLTATDLASPPLADEEETSALDQAQEFLREMLADGPVLYDTVTTAVKQAGIAMATLKRAKPLVGVKARRQPEGGKNGPWEWYLPGEVPPADTTRSHRYIDADETHETVVEPKQNQGDTPDTRLAHMSRSLDSAYCQQNQGDSTSVSRVSSPMYRGAEPLESSCPAGGHHTWLRRQALGDQLCTRCNATRLLVEGSP